MPVRRRFAQHQRGLGSPVCPLRIEGRHPGFDQRQNVAASQTDADRLFLGVNAGGREAGEVVVVTKLASAQTSDTLSDPSRPLLVTPWALPEALLPAAVAAASRADEDKMPVAFRELASEDPALRIEHDPGTGQVVLWTTGPAHLDLVLARLRGRYNVAVDRVPVKVAMKETAVGRAEAGQDYRQILRAYYSGAEVAKVY